jgi:hypothetical protein
VTTEYALRMIEGGEPEVIGYASTILGRPWWIRNPVGIPKPREECQPFTFTLYPLEDLPSGETVERPRVYRGRMTREEAEKNQAKFVKAISKKVRKSRKTRSEEILAAFLRLKFPARRFDS